MQNRATNMKDHRNAISKQVKKKGNKREYQMKEDRVVRILRFDNTPCAGAFINSKQPFNI